MSKIVTIIYSKDIEFVLKSVDDEVGVLKIEVQDVPDVAKLTRTVLLERGVVADVN